MTENKIDKDVADAQVQLAQIANDPNLTIVGQHHFMDTKTTQLEVGTEELLLNKSFYTNNRGEIIFVFNSFIRETDKWKGRKYQYWNFSENKIYELTNGLINGYYYPLQDDQLKKSLRKKLLEEIGHKLNEAEKLEKIQNALN